MQIAGFNCNGKIYFFNGGIDVEVLMNTDQQVTLKLSLLDCGKILITTLVYAKCDAIDRLELWDDIYSLSSSMNSPWLVGGDFNVILNEKEKIGGLPVHQTEIEDFAFCKYSCDLQDIDFRAVYLLGGMMEHLSRTGSDHASLVLTAGEQAQQFCKPFIFLKFWQLTIREDIVKIKERLFEEDPSEVNRMVLQQAQAEFKRHLHFEEEFWKQKAGVKWQSEGDRNTRFFHSLVNGRRKRMQLNRIQNDDGAWLEDRDQIATAAIDIYQQQFSSEPTSSDYSILEHV
ncbi:uncharacterized protein LOC132631021 [Lycium barbarum]|uniref:uncharacterized protein LOC132631021 n=1 Tax=Lycium barbarum TaxID=112863 RepID=UPI00293E05B0|nr:uncharacterized protein LOC132631021 [Lycium barbarum]